MSAPWIQYEAYDIKVVNNIIHDTDGAGLGVNGGYDILMAYNTMYRVGARDHILEAVFGSRSCDGVPGNAGRERCQQYLDQGGWGTTIEDNGSNNVRIPNKNVFIYNNVVYNPPGFHSAWQQFAIYDPYTNPVSSHVPTAVTDDNLQIRGNVIWNNDGINPMPLGIENNTQACVLPYNSTCNAAQLIADNAINTVQPQFVNAASGDFHLTGTWANSVTTYAIPSFPAWDIAGVDAGNISNAVLNDFEDTTRATTNPPGAYYFGAPIVASVVRVNSNPTNVASVDFTATFSKSVAGVNIVAPFDDFAVTMAGGVSGAFVTGVTVDVTGSIYTVSVNTGSGNGTIRLDVLDDDSIVDAQTTPLNGAFTSGQTYVIDKTAPTILSITRAESNPTSAIGVDFTVTFDEPVTGVASGDFSLDMTGVIGATVGSVRGSGATRTVTVNTGTGDGAIRLDVLSATIIDLAGNSLAGLPFTSGAAYTVDKSITRYSTAANDGWVLESREFSNVAGSRNNAGNLRVGDDTLNRQYRSLLYFDTSSLPNKAKITKVTLRIEQAGTITGDDISPLGALVADMKKGLFGLTPLEFMDFNAAADPVNTGRFTVGGGWYQLRISPLYFKYINVFGAIQFRLRFTKDDNNDKAADFISFYSGDAALDADKPQLLIEYSTP
jgi:hypothetical protein